MLEEAVQSSYRRGGEEASLGTDVSRQTVKNKIHQLEFPKNEERPEKKKEVDYPYIDADEDHISLQFQGKKGDLTEKENHQKNNDLITKLVYIYEGIENESPKSKRHCLVNPYYFCDGNTGDGNQKFWDEIYEYMESHYDLEKVKRIYVNSDGGSQEIYPVQLDGSKEPSWKKGWGYREPYRGACGAEYDVLSSAQILVSERNRHGELGKYVESISHSMSLQNRKRVDFNAHIWGL